MESFSNTNTLSFLSLEQQCSNTSETLGWLSDFLTLRYQSTVAFLHPAHLDIVLSHGTEAALSTVTLWVSERYWGIFSAVISPEEQDGCTVTYSDSRMLSQEELYWQAESPMGPLPFQSYQKVQSNDESDNATLGSPSIHPFCLKQSKFGYILPHGIGKHSARPHSH